METGKGRLRSDESRRSAAKIGNGRSWKEGTAKSRSFGGNRERELITLIYVHVEMGALVCCVCKYLS